MVSDSTIDPLDMAAAPVEQVDEDTSMHTTMEKLEKQLQKQELMNAQFEDQLKVMNTQINTNSTRLSSSIQEFQSSMQLIFQELKSLKQAQANSNSQDVPSSTIHSVPHKQPVDPSSGILGSGPNPGNGSVAHSFVKDHTVPQLHHNIQNNQQSSFSLLHHKTMRLEFPLYSGVSDVLAWIKQTELVFKFYQTPDIERVQICSFHLRDEALQWFHWLAINIENYFEWEVFKEEILTRFSTVDLQRPFEALSAVKQTSTVREYLSKFEQILSLLTKLPHAYIVDRFVGGLRDDIRYEILSSRPQNLRDAIALAKLSEDKFNNMRKPVRQLFQPPFKPHYTTPQPSTLVPRQFPPKTTPEYSFKPSQFSNAKKLTSTEIMQRRSQELCYTCDEKWFPGHKCQNKHIFVLEGILQGDQALIAAETVATEDNITAVPFDQIPNSQPSISLEAMCGVAANNTIRLQGNINGQIVHMLIDSGSTHNFINSDLAQKLGLPIDHTQVFEVYIASGEKLQGQGTCSAVTLSCQGTKIVVDFLLLPMGGCQVVLGVQWLRELDDIIFNFKKLQIKFTLHNKVVLWQGIQVKEPQFVSAHAISKDLTSHCFSFMLRMTHSVTTVSPLKLLHKQSPSSSFTVPPDLQAVLDKFPSVFTPL